MQKPPATPTSKKRQSKKTQTYTRLKELDYTKQVHFHVARECVFDAITTLEGLGGWWTPIVRGQTTVGDELRFSFEGLNEYIAMRVDKINRPSSVHWTCIIHTSLPEWAGTQPKFDLVAETPHSCELHFRHVGLTPKLECFHDCKLGWDHFLASLVEYVERGKGMPFGA